MDTRNKRASAIFPLMPWRCLLPSPDSTISQADQQMVVFLYGGILAGTPVAPTVIIPTERIYNVPFEDRDLEIPLEDRVLEVSRES